MCLLSNENGADAANAGRIGAEGGNVAPCAWPLSPLAYGRGFTLLEVLVALMVIAVGLAAAIRVGASSGANASHLRDKTFAQYVAANKATELQLQADWPALGTQRGRAALGPVEWRWATHVSETFDARVRRVDVEVGRDGEAPLVTLTAFLPQPASPTAN